MRELETLKEAGSRGAGLRILIGKRTGSVLHLRPLPPKASRHMVKSAIELAEITTEDPHAGLPDPAELGSIRATCSLYSDDVDTLRHRPQNRYWRKRAEEAALSADPRITNSEGASFDTHIGRHVFANSRGFAGEYRSSYCSLSTVPVAREGESMERDYWYTPARAASPASKPPKQSAASPPQRALRRLGAVKVETQKVPVVFEPRTARSLLDNIFEAVHGGVDLPPRVLPRRQTRREGRLRQSSP